MKTLFFILSFFILVYLRTFSQTDYQAEKYVGPQDYTSNMRPNGKLILKGPVNDTLSEWQNIPFDFYFYGQKVNGYFISDDGYITFSNNAKHIEYNNTSIPSSSEPNNAIYGYWEKLKLENVMTMWSNEIRSITLGQPPERFHVIMWISSVPEAENYSSAGLSFAIVLMEKNSVINIVYIAGRKNTRLNGIIGIENEDGSKGLMLENSPNYDFPYLTSIAADDITYTFSENTLSKEYEVSINENIRIYPNPTQDFINILSNDQDFIKQIIIYSIEGEKLFEQNNINQSSQTIGMRNLSKGTYLIQVNLISGKDIYKFFIKD